MEQKHRSNETPPTSERGDQAFDPAEGRHATPEERGEAASTTSETDDREEN